MPNNPALLHAEQKLFNTPVSTLDNTPSPAHREGVEWAVENRILRGSADADLMLRKNLTREQYCTMNKRTVDWLME